MSPFNRLHTATIFIRRQQFRTSISLRHNRASEPGADAVVCHLANDLSFNPSYDMKTKPQEQRDWHERRLEEVRQRKVAPEPTKDSAHGQPVKGGAPEPRESRSTAKQRTKKPGSAGLANEARPGLGTRADGGVPMDMPKTPLKEAKSRSKPEATRHGYEEPRPEPREQESDSRAHEEERSTGESGHSGIT